MQVIYFVSKSGVHIIDVHTQQTFILALALTDQVQWLQFFCIFTLPTKMSKAADNE
jgi:hypothetical protein